MASLVSVQALKLHFTSFSGGLLRPQRVVIKAVDGVDFTIDEGETLGLVGESGCGKSSLGRALLRLIEPTSGQVFFDGHDILEADAKEMRALRRRMQIIFQDPFASLNPRMSVGSIIEEALIIHKIGTSKAQRRERVLELLTLVGLRAEAYARYPHEFSGGQRQRIGIARALVLEPQFVVCDEPVSALDVSIQAQIINLMQDLQHRLKLTYLFIAHDLHVVRHMASRIAVMYLGAIVEIADAAFLYDNARHPYTQALLSALPVPDPSRKPTRILLSGEVPSPMAVPAGCKFHTRCPHAQAICRQEQPALRTINARHQVACHLVSA